VFDLEVVLGRRSSVDCVQCTRRGHPRGHSRIRDACLAIGKQQSRGPERGRLLLVQSSSGAEAAARCSAHLATRARPIRARAFGQRQTRVESGETSRRARLLRGRAESRESRRLPQDGASEQHSTRLSWRCDTAWRGR